MSVFARSTMHLLKRDNMGFAIHPALIVLCVMLGAGALVIAGAGISRMYAEQEENRAFWVRSPEQESYMREVRDRNINQLMHEGRRSHMRGPAYGKQSAAASMYSEV